WPACASCSASSSCASPRRRRSRPTPGSRVPRRPVLCLVTDRRRLSPDARTTRDEITTLEAAIDEAVGVGIDVIQLREPDLEVAERAGLCARVVQRTRGTATRILVNDRVDVAMTTAADGAHLRSDGPPAARIRAIAPSGWCIGRSIHAAAEVDASAPV